MDGQDMREMLYQETWDMMKRLYRSADYQEAKEMKDAMNYLGAAWNTYLINRGKDDE